METRTIIESIDSSLNICHNDKILSLGSCFAVSIGEKLKEAKFDALVNPFGTLYHPLSIQRLLTPYENVLLHDNHPRITSYAEQYLHYDYHSDIRADGIPTLQDVIRQRHNTLAGRLKQANVILITLGTSYYFELKSDGAPVANCHKQPASLFDKHLISSETLNASLEQICSHIFINNPSAQIIWTVSPIRHIKESLINNNRSKAQLITAIHELVDDNHQCHYFPAYELMMDDLRDYRYYKSDMIHPNEMAVDYIWDLFIRHHMNAETQAKVGTIAKFNKSMEHRPFNPNSSEHHTFKISLHKRIKAFQDKEGIDFSRELRTLKEA